MNDCLFCKIVSGAIPADKVYEDDNVLAFRDISPKAPAHVLIIPKKHVESVAALDEDDFDTVGHIFRVAKKLSEEFELEDGFRIVANTGPDGGQTVYHLHFHLMGGRAMGWPPG